MLQYPNIKKTFLSSIHSNTTNNLVNTSNVILVILHQQQHPYQKYDTDVLLAFQWLNLISQTKEKSYAPYVFDELPKNTRFRQATSGLRNELARVQKI